MKKKKLVLIGSSTGGPGHLSKIVSSLDKTYPNTIIIAQHMDALFIDSLASRISEQTALQTSVVVQNQTIEPSTIVVTKDLLSQLSFSKQRGLHIVQAQKDGFFHPSVNSLFCSGALLSEEFEILACLLTGIGTDGANGLLSLKESGAQTLAESQSSCIVYGMPKAALELGAVERTHTLEEIIEKIRTF